jgi:hypothetical protein
MSTIFQFPIPASLARRLAEAADGFRNVPQVFFIAGYARPHAFKDFPDLTSAETYFSEKGLSVNDYGIFGPYKTYDDVEKLNLTGIEDFAKVDIDIYLKNGDHQKFSLPGGIDAIFLNLSSLEKFVFPYYCHLYGVEYAQQMRTNLIDQYKDLTKGSNIVMAIPKEHAGGTLMKGLINGEELPG